MCTAYGQPHKTLSAEAAAMLRAFPWPGNVRQLEHAIEHAVVMAGDELKLLPAHLPVELGRDRPVQLARLLEDAISLEELERRYTLLVLDRNNGSRAATARALGIGTNTLWRKLKAWGVPGASNESV